MRQSLDNLTCADLSALASAAGGGRLTRPYSAVAVGRLLGPLRAGETAEELEGLSLDPAPLATVLSLLAAEREVGQGHARRIELVWTGPESGNSRSRDTGVVVRELF